MVKNYKIRHMRCVPQHMTRLVCNKISLHSFHQILREKKERVARLWISKPATWQLEKLKFTAVLVNSLVDLHICPEEKRLNVLVAVRIFIYWMNREHIWLPRH